MLRKRNLHRRLSAGRPQPRPEFVDALSASVTNEPARPPLSSRLAFVLAAVVLLLGTAAAIGGAAYGGGGSAAQDQYGPSKPSVGVAGAQQPPAILISAPPRGGGGVLPFSGLSLGVTAVVGFGLLGTGFALRRLEKRRSSRRT
jgi:hypothetical protein